MKKKAYQRKINEKSYVGNAYNYYFMVDSYIEKNTGSSNHCPTGCNNCCYDYFHIAIREFYAIVHYIKNEFGIDYILDKIKLAEKYYDEFRVKFPEEYRRNNTIINGGIDKDNFDKVMQIYYSDKNIQQLTTPCIFLNSKGKCDIYPVRPDPCRLYGSAYNSEYNNINCCNKVVGDKLVDLKPLGSQAQMYYDMFASGKLVRGYSIIDWFATILPSYLKNPEIINQSAIQSEFDFDRFRNQCLAKMHGKS